MMLLHSETYSVILGRLCLNTDKSLQKSCKFNMVEDFAVQEKKQICTFKMLRGGNVSGFTRLPLCCHAENGKKDHLSHSIRE